MFDTKNLDPKLVRSIPIVYDGTKFIENLIIPLDEIYVPPIGNNPIRKKGKDPKTVGQLAHSLRQGIHYAERPPCVYKYSQMLNGKSYKYVLVAGNHRFEALSNNNYKEWIFAVYEFALDGHSLLGSLGPWQLIENDDKPPRLESSVEDVVNMIVRFIDQNDPKIDTSSNGLRVFVRKHTRHRSEGVITEICNKVRAKCGVYTDMVTYTARDVKCFVDENTDYVTFGKFDSKRDKFGWSVLEGYEYESVVNALRKFFETGKESIFLCHTKAPNDNMDLQSKRENMIASFDARMDHILAAAEFYRKNGRMPYTIEGFLPQDLKANEKSIIKMDKR
jgi:hypothetical protein